jgi:large subunit ribosomal protein L35Ae
MSELDIKNLKGVFNNYRQSKHVIHPKQAIISFDEINTRKQAYQLIGKTVAWKSNTGKLLKGKITRVHGKKGAVVANFKKAGLPGQAMGDQIHIVK